VARYRFDDSIKGADSQTAVIWNSNALMHRTRALATDRPLRLRGSLMLLSEPRHEPYEAGFSLEE
jgi:hypothetical protein